LHPEQSAQLKQGTGAATAIRCKATVAPNTSEQNYDNLFTTMEFVKKRLMLTPLARMAPRKRALVLLVGFLIALLASGILLNAILYRQARREIDNRATFFMDTMLAVREYTSLDVNPIIAPLNAKSLDFLPEAVPSYAATKVYSYLKSKQNYQQYLYREATLNPTNLKDRADRFEARIIEIFRADSSIKEQVGTRFTGNSELHYFARPIVVNKVSCLKCHSTPDQAPASQLATYGTVSGFGWQLGEIVGAQIVSVPVEEVEAAKSLSFLSIVLMFFAALAVLSVLLVSLTSVLRFR
jgi:hypothetical protein